MQEHTYVELAFQQERAKCCLPSRHKQHRSLCAFSAVQRPGMQLLSSLLPGNQLLDGPLLGGELLGRQLPGQQLLGSCRAGIHPMQLRLSDSCSSDLLADCNHLLGARIHLLGARAHANLHICTSAGQVPR